jgi:PncC family amidohydrolase
VPYTLAHDFSPINGNRLNHDTINELAKRINDLLRERTDLTIAAAESCTGGSIAQAITAWSGSSNYFLGSIVSYVNDAKHELLGVPTEVLESRGAVSSECATAMAIGARRAFHADCAISTTGIAGPNGATVRKPVGLVYIARADNHATIVQEHHFAGDRAAVTTAATVTALKLLLEAIESHINGIHQNQLENDIVD